MGVNAQLRKPALARLAYILSVGLDPWRRADRMPHWLPVNSISKTGELMRYELADHEWATRAAIYLLDLSA